MPKSDAVDILVGYFYFSGYVHLADKYLRILVGLDIDTRISNRVREVEELAEWQRIRSKVREEYINNLVRLINETDNTDTDETVRMWRLRGQVTFPIKVCKAERKSMFGLQTKGKYTEGKQIFDELWANAIPIVDENTVDRWKEKVESTVNHIYPFI